MGGVTADTPGSAEVAVKGGAKRHRRNWGRGPLGEAGSVGGVTAALTSRNFLCPELVDGVTANLSCRVNFDNGQEQIKRAEIQECISYS